MNKYGKIGKTGHSSPLKDGEPPEETDPSASPSGVSGWHKAKIIAEIAGVALVLPTVWFAWLDQRHQNANLQVALQTAITQRDDYANEVPNVLVTMDAERRGKGYAYVSADSPQQESWTWTYFRALVSNTTQSQTSLTRIDLGENLVYFYRTDGTGHSLSGINDPIGIGKGDSVIITFLMATEDWARISAPDGNVTAQFAFAGSTVDAVIHRDGTQDTALLPDDLSEVSTQAGDADPGVDHELCLLGLLRSERENTPSYGQLTPERRDEICPPPAAP